MVSMHFDFFCNYLLPFECNHSDIVQGLKEGKVDEKIVFRMNEYGAQSIENRLVLYLNLMRYNRVNMVNDPTRIITTIEQYSDAAQKENSGRYEGFRDAALEFLKPNQQAFIACSIIFSKQESLMAIKNARENPASDPHPPEPG